MTEPSPEESSNPDGSAGWDALPPDGEPPGGEPPAEDDAEDTERTSSSGS